MGWGSRGAATDLERILLVKPLLNHLQLICPSTLLKHLWLSPLLELQ